MGFGRIAPADPDARRRFTKRPQVEARRWVKLPVWREIVAQALDYASWVNDLSYEQIQTITKNFTGKQLPQAFSEHYGFPIPQTVNGSHAMVILASELDDSSERIVQYLAEQYGVPINALFFTFFKTAYGEFVGRAWLKDPEEMQEGTQARNQPPWSGYSYLLLFI